MLLLPRLIPFTTLSTYVAFMNVHLQNISVHASSAPQLVPYLIPEDIQGGVEGTVRG